MLGFSIITIASFVTALNEIVKYIGVVLCKKDVTKIIPIFSIIFGIGLGIAGYYTPNVEMGSNIIEAIFIGLSAGSSSTGLHQVSKQLNKTDMEVPDIVMDSVVPNDLLQDVINEENNTTVIEEEITITNNEE